MHICSHRQYGETEEDGHEEKKEERGFDEDEIVERILRRVESKSRQVDGRVEKMFGRVEAVMARMEGLVSRMEDVVGRVEDVVVHVEDLVEQRDETIYEAPSGDIMAIMDTERPADPGAPLFDPDRVVVGMGDTVYSPEEPPGFTYPDSGPVDHSDAGEGLGETGCHGASEEDAPELVVEPNVCGEERDIDVTSNDVDPNGSQLDELCMDALETSAGIAEEEVAQPVCLPLESARVEDAKSPEIVVPSAFLAEDSQRQEEMDGNEDDVTSHEEASVLNKLTRILQHFIRFDQHVSAAHLSDANRTYSCKSSFHASISLYWRWRQPLFYIPNSRLYYLNFELSLVCACV